MIRRGEPWEEPSEGAIPPPLVRGTDHDLAHAVAAGGRELRFEPTGPSDLAHALGLDPGRAGGGAASTVDVDLIHVGEGEVAVNSVVLGIPPHRLRRWHRSRSIRMDVDGRPLHVRRSTTVAVVNGGWIEGFDVAPRAHPGDGRLDLQIYAVPGPQRGELRRRLATASHLPHPGVTERRVRAVTVEFDRPWGCVIDGRDADPRDRLELEVLRGALRLHLGRPSGRPE